MARSGEVDAAYDLIKRRGTKREGIVVAHHLAYGRSGEVVALAAAVAARTALRIVA